jgi:hypothetical protein
MLFVEVVVFICIALLNTICVEKYRRKFFLKNPRRQRRAKEEYTE